MEHSEIRNNEEEFTDICQDLEPLGYQHFLYDVNIEYNLGGGRDSSAGNRHCFKLKYLPYMIKANDIRSIYHHDNSVTSSDSSICDSQSIQDYVPSPSLDSRHIDVTKATCAFLGNSDFVPNYRFKHRRVVLELISAKLSQLAPYNLSNSYNHSSLVTLPERLTDADHSNRSVQNAQRVTNHTSLTTHLVENSPNNKSYNGNISLSSTSPILSSKRFVNYTLLIKTTPGLDNHPAVIERRFSDFLLLYQGLKSHEAYAKVVDKYVTFPKKVYMGNFSLTNIAERSILFTRLLDLCTSKTHLLWSIPFISFLLDKELKEAHRLTLCGDPDDMQALIETAYYILQKLYLDGIKTQAVSSSSSSLEDASTNSHILPINVPDNTDPSITSAISPTSGYFSINQNDHSNMTSSPNNSLCDTSEGLDGCLFTKLSSAALNQRILVTFCMLFLTYYRGENYRELKLAVQGFSQLIASQDYVDSMSQTRHHMTLRACLVFLMNMNKGDVIDENQRMWLKQRLEDIDGAQTNLNEAFNGSTSTDYNNPNGANNLREKRNHSNDNINGNTNMYRLTKGDLTSLLRDRNFCSFQDGKFTK